MNVRNSLRILAWVTWALIAILTVSVGSVLYSGSPGPTRPVVTSSDLASSIGGPFELTTLKGQRFTNADIVGRRSLIFFGFTHCPDVCPTTLHEITVMMKELGADGGRLTPIFITVDPERDTPQMLSEYMTSFDSRIIALYGTPAQTDRAVKAFKAYYEKVPGDGGSYTVAHTGNVLLMNSQGHFVGTLDMHEPNETRLAKLRRFLN